MWKNKVGKCDKCGKQDNLHPSFGKWICGECKDSRPRKGLGHSGMFVGENLEWDSISDNLYIERVPKSNKVFGRLFFEHYPNSKGIPGRSFCYLIHNHSRICGIIGFNSPPRNYKTFRCFFNTEDDTLYMNNNVFRIIETEKNLGTRILKIARNTLQKDHIERWGYPLVGLVTFVELPRDGAIYKADNWDYLGLTKGFQMRRDKNTWDRIYSQGTRKHIFGYKYR